MKLFDGFEAVRFPEENLIFVTHDQYLYYIYFPKYESWRKYGNAGNDCITVSNYEEISKEELANAMHGVFPTKETDFLRLCHPSYLCIRDMLELLKADYPVFMADYEIYHSVHEFLLNSDICHKSYSEIKKLFDNASSHQQDKKQVLTKLKELCFAFIGRDIFKTEIGIVDGHDSSSYFWIMPVRVIDYSNTDEIDSVTEMRSVEISIEENDVYQFLSPFLFKYFDNELEANKKRIDYYSEDEDGNERPEYKQVFEWYLTHNFYTFDSVRKMIEEIRDTIDALSNGRENEFTEKLRERKALALFDRLEEVSNPEELIVDFYRRFIYRMEYMMTVGKEKGYNLISFMGP